MLEKARAKQELLKDTPCLANPWKGIEEQWLRDLEVEPKCTCGQVADIKWNYELRKKKKAAKKDP